MRSTPVLFAVALLAACDKEPVPGDLLPELEPLVPAWDLAHMDGTLETATVQCTVEDLQRMIDTLSCHADTDVATLCGEDAACYAELSLDCDVPGDFRDTCIEKYSSTIVDDAPSMTDDECREANLALDLVAAAGAGDETAIAAALPDGAELFSEGGVYENMNGLTAIFVEVEESGFDDVCWIAFEATTDESYFDHPEGAILVDCVADGMADLGSCERDLLGEYKSMGGTGILAKLRFAIESSTTDCKGGVMIAGHGNGAAVGTLMAADLATGDPDIYDPETIGLVTFGAPRVLADDSVAGLAEAVPTRRFVAWGDLAPGLPAADFSHFGDTRELYKPWFGGVRHHTEADDFASPVGLEGGNALSVYEERLEDCF